MDVLQEIGGCCVHCSLGLTILIVVTASEYSGIGSILALPIAAFAVTVSALCGASLPSHDLGYKKRRLGDTLDFFGIWLEILEILSATATCARVASATVDYVSNGRMREWFLGLQSHSLGEPWPDLIGVSVVVVVTGLFMLGLEKSPSFLILLVSAIIATFVFFVGVGGTHTVIPLKQWSEDIKSTSVQSILTAATLCSYGFVSTFPKLETHKTIKIAAMVLVPLLLYSSTILTFTLMSHYKELAGTASPLLKVFELRDVDWARPVTAICIICISCLALTEILPNLYGLFVILASREWQIFLTSLQYRSSVTGAPMLAIFASGSLAAILAFACPLAYLLKILSLSTLLKCTFRSLRVLLFLYKSEKTDESYLVQPSSTQYSKLKQYSSKAQSESAASTSRRKYFGILPYCLKNTASVSGTGARKKKSKAGKSRDDEYLLLNDYCDRSAALAGDGTSDEESDLEKESVLSTDADEESGSSTDIDAVVQEYKDKVQVATVDNFNEMRRPTFATSIAAAVCVLAVATSAICASQAVRLRIFHLLWPSLLVMGFSSSILVVLLPKNASNLRDDLLPKCLLPIFATFSVQVNLVLASTIVDPVWPGFLFWFAAGALLFWRCDCCTCEGLLHNQGRLNITENVAQCPDKIVDTILIAR